MNLSAKRCTEIVAAFPQAKIAVVGDFMADIYLDASPLRLSREAPVMIVSHRGETLIPGGAANAINNLLAMGAKVYPFGVIGNDEAGTMLMEFFSGHGCATQGLIKQDDYVTVSKTRVMVSDEGRSAQQVLRIDREGDQRPDAGALDALREALFEVLDEVDAVVFSDYGYGSVSAALFAEIRQREKAPLLTVDSRYAMKDFQRADLVTPNHSEAQDLVGHAVVSDEQTLTAAKELRAQLDARVVLITRGNRGMMLLEGSEQDCGDYIAASGSADEVTDVSGAGDTVISLATLALVSGASPAEAARIANYGAGVVVTKLGAATLSPQELIQAATQTA